MIEKKKAPNNESNNNYCMTPLYQKRLIESSRFVCYKSDKIPYNARTKRKCDYTKKNNHSNYEDACNSMMKTSDFEGIGFVLGYDEEKGYNYCGLDIDNCINAQGEIHPKALELIEMLDTYTEISRSGKGIHCIFHARKRGDICKNSNLDFCKCLELYDNGRYFALTGNIIRNKDIEHRQKQCDRLYERYFKHKEVKVPTIKKNPKSVIKKAVLLNDVLEKDARFKNYWYRQITITDESVSDLSFFISLAYWLDNNPELMQAWFYRSPYYLGKDDAHKKKANRKDYIARTIKQAINYRQRGGK